MRMSTPEWRQLQESYSSLEVDDEQQREVFQRVDQVFKQIERRKLVVRPPFTSLPTAPLPCLSLLGG